MIRGPLLTRGAILGAPAGAVAQVAPAADTALHLTCGAFADGSFACEFNRPANFDRAFTTQPARHDEFDVNLGAAGGLAKRSGFLVTPLALTF
jgi:hypothetical protein